jgi:xanthine dehydrogenase YagT iron-sulfur-binding subunit
MHMTNEASGAGPVSAPPSLGPGPVNITLTVNGRPHAVTVDPRVTLLDALRERLKLTGTKKGCDRGECGACTVHINGRRVLSCMTLAVMHIGGEITTIEGVAQGDHLHPVQAAFIDHDGFQCGYCTSGQIMSALALLEEIRRGEPSAATADIAVASIPLTEDEIRERMSGNICRCSCYPQIVASVGQAGAATTAPRGGS